MNRQIQRTVIVLAVWSQVAVVQLSSAGPPSPGVQFAPKAGLPERVLHFPPNQSIGEIILVDANYVVPEVSREFHPGYVFAPGQHLGPARGEVHIPAGQCVCLQLGGKGVTRQQCIDCLKSVDPNAVQDLDFLPPLPVDDSFLPYVARLTGMTHFCPVTARFTPHGWSLLRQLPCLEHICTPHGLTDAEIAEIAKLPVLREMEIVADRLTDAGLASLGSMRTLQVLHLEGTPLMTDAGLKALARSTSLRHLRLSGPFTNRGLACLADMPALKVLWLEAPKCTGEGLRPLSQCRSLERLCVPWLDRITSRGLMHLHAIPGLKALGVGNGWRSDAGVLSLASLTNLEVLALQGGRSLTDDGLKPLVAMPKLRALEIYNSRITEQGLTNLYPCKMLDSVQIKTSAPISQQAVARLKTELPNLQTLDISQPEVRRGAKSLSAGRR
jgi:hypothetical protein